MLSTKAFQRFGHQVVLFCNVTTRLAKDPDQGLLRRKGGRGFPYMVFMDARGEVIYQQQTRTFAAMQQSLRSVKILAALDKPKLLKDNSVAVRVLLAKAALEMLSRRELEARAKTLQFSKKQRRELDGLLADLEVGDLYMELVAAGQRQAVPARFHVLKRQGRIPTGRRALLFWSQLARHAEAQKDAALMRDCLQGLEQQLGEATSAAQLRRYRALLKTW